MMPSNFNRILVLAAMKEEEAAILTELDGVPSRESLVGRSLRIRLRTFELGASTLLLAQSGMGPVNAALALAMIHEHHEIDAVILLGVGGSLRPELRIGDAVVARRVLQHDSLSSLEFGDPRMSPGDLILSKADAGDHVAAIPTDAAWVERISAALPADRTALGTLISGSEFVGTSLRKKALQALDPEALLVDMEAAGVAQVSRRLGLPFAVVKTVADRLHPDGSIEADFRACLGAAAANAARILRIAFIGPAGNPGTNGAGL